MKLIILMLLVLALPAHAEVLFEDNFDSQADWQPRPVGITNDASPSGGSISCDVGSCSGTQPPTNWSYYRATGWWWGPTYQDTLRITADQGRGGSGKSFIVHNESNIGASGDGWGADGILAKKLPQDYQEIYARVWVKMKLGWQWANPADMMIKMFRVYHYDNSGSIFLLGSAGNVAPNFIWDFKHSNTWGTRWVTTVRCDPQATDYSCTNPSIPSDSLFVSGDMAIEPNGTGMLANGEWHRLDFHLKMNTYSGSVWNSDGVFEFWYDGTLKESYSNIQYKRSGSDPAIGWNTVGLGGNAYNTYTDAANFGEQWYAMDDVVISTTPIAADYVIGEPEPPAEDTTPPVTYCSKSGRYQTSQTVTLSANETATSVYCLTTTTCNPATDYSSAVKVLVNIPYQKLCYKSTDTATNAETTKCTEFRKQRAR